MEHDDYLTNVKSYNTAMKHKYRMDDNNKYEMIMIVEIQMTDIYRQILIKQDHSQIPI